MNHGPPSCPLAGYVGRVVEVLPPCGSDPGMSSCNLAIALVEVDGDAPANQDVVQNLDVCTLYRPPLGIPVSCWGAVHLLRARGLLCIGPPVMSWAVHGAAAAPWLHVRRPLTSLSSPSSACGPNQPLPHPAPTPSLLPCRTASLSLWDWCRCLASGSTCW